MSLSSQIALLATRTGVEAKALRTLLNNNAGDLTALTTTDKSNLVSALNEIKAAVDAIDVSSVINDATTGVTITWSSNKISSEISTAVDGIINGAPGTLDTLNEIATALQNDANSVATILAEQAKRVAVNMAQTFTPAEQAQARANIGVASATDVGDVNTDFVATFNSALV